MALSQTFLHPKLNSGFLSKSYLDNKSEVLLPVNRTILCSALVNHRGGNKSRTLHRFCCPEMDSDTLFSLNKRRVLREAAVAEKIMESTDTTPPCTGLGIVDFLRDKNLLITGATGFLAKGMQPLPQVINYSHLYTLSLLNTCFLYMCSVDRKNIEDATRRGKAVFDNQG